MSRSSLHAASITTLNGSLAEPMTVASFSAAAARSSVTAGRQPLPLGLPAPSRLPPRPPDTLRLV